MEKQSKKCKYVCAIDTSLFKNIVNNIPELHKTIISYLSNCILQRLKHVIAYITDIDCYKKNLIFLVERRKEIHGDSLDKQHKKKIERDEEKLKNNNRDLSLVKMKSMFATGFAFTALLSMFNSM